MKVLVIFGTLLIATLSQGELDSSLAFPEQFKNAERIIDGYPVSRGEYPFMVRLQTSILGGTRVCGGSLISPRYVMTAAHCLIGGTNVQVLMGNIDVDQPSEAVNTDRYITHPLFNATTLHNDIGLVDLKENVTYAPVLLPTQNNTFNSYENVTAKVLGWGRIEDNGGQSQYLNQADMMVITNARCQSSFGSNVINSTVCAIGQRMSANSGPCQGDSGGPLFTSRFNETMVQIGIVSFVSNSGCSTSTPSGFVRPHFYWPWISEWTGIPIRT